MTANYIAKNATILPHLLAHLPNIWLIRTLAEENRLEQQNRGHTIFPAQASHNEKEPERSPAPAENKAFRSHRSLFPCKVLEHPPCSSLSLDAASQAWELEPGPFSVKTRKIF